MVYYHTHTGHYGVGSYAAPFRHAHAAYAPHVHGAYAGQRTGYDYPYSFLLPPVTNIATQWPYYGGYGYGGYGYGGYGYGGYYY